MNVERFVPRPSESSGYVSEAARQDADIAVGRVACLLEGIDVGPLDDIMRAEVSADLGVNGRVRSVRWHLRLFDNRAKRLHSVACMIPAIEIFDARHLAEQVMVCTKSAFVKLIMESCWKPCAPPRGAV